LTELGKILILEDKPLDYLRVHGNR